MSERTLPEEYVGVTYEQRSRALRWRRAGAFQTSERPWDDARGAALPGPPTLVTFEANDDAPVASWLRSGAIVTHEEPAPKRKASEADGEKKADKEPEAGG